MRKQIYSYVEDSREIIDACRAGDDRAREVLYQHFASKMYGVCLRYAADADEAQDFLQEGFITVFARLRDFRFEGSLEGWIRRIMVNTCLGALRKNRMQLVRDLNLPFEAENDGYTDPANLAAADLLSIIQELPPQYRSVFNLYAIEGYSHREIGTALGISEGTSKSNLSRAREILQRRIANLYGKKKSQPPI